MDRRSGPDSVKLIQTSSAICSACFQDFQAWAAASRRRWSAKTRLIVWDMQSLFANESNGDTSFAARPRLLFFFFFFLPRRGRR